MIMLLRSSLRRYVTGYAFWLSLITLMLLGVLGALEIGPEARLDDFYLLAQGPVFAIMIVLNVGKEIGDGVIRNKIATGYTKGQIYVSELVLALGLSLGLLIVTSLPFLMIDNYIFKEIPTQAIVKTYVGILFMNLATVSLCVTVCCLISRKAISAVTALILVVGMIFGGIFLYDQLNRDEYFYGYTTNEFGEREEHKVKNNYYVDEPLRSIYTFCYKIIPTGQLIEYSEILSPYFSKYDIKLSIPNEEQHILDTAPLYSLAMLSVISCGGYVLFCKKNIK